MKTLFIINNPTKLASCLEHIGQSDGILLIEDAVLAAREALAKTCTDLLVLEDDLIARGIKSTNSQWQAIDYEGFVSKTLSFDKSVSWL
ncbi:MAG: sulfurtransferase complex subunit TusB [Gammaproteobacteria bacterium]|nr:sulfurtransferase complex subunit TusB [Gammaproteobacteria bacterium]